ncbi:MAG: hypothetical protein ACLUW6_05240 [Coriobacteriaceae bacterium]
MGLERPGINGVGIVPLGFTKHQTALRASRRPGRPRRHRCDRPFQQRAGRARRPWVRRHEFMNAFSAGTPARPASDCSDYDMFEDGIGIVRPMWTSSKRLRKRPGCPRR